MYDHYLQCNDTVLNRTKHKKYLIGGTMVEPCIISQLYITKQLEYVTKDHIATHTILLWLYSLVFEWYNCFK